MCAVRTTQVMQLATVVRDKLTHASRCPSSVQVMRAVSKLSVSDLEQLVTWRLQYLAAAVDRATSSGHAETVGEAVEELRHCLRLDTQPLLGAAVVQWVPASDAAQVAPAARAEVLWGKDGSADSEGSAYGIEALRARMQDHPSCPNMLQVGRAVWGLGARHVENLLGWQLQALGEELFKTAGQGVSREEQVDLLREWLGLPSLSTS